MYGAQNLIQTMQGYGIFDVILPFILIFTIVFAVLEKIKLLSKEDGRNRKYSSMIALVMSMSVIVQHVLGYGSRFFGGESVVTIINNALPQVSLLLVAIVMMLLTIGLWTGKRADGSKGAGAWFTLISAALVVIIFVASIGWWNAPYWLTGLLNSQVIALVIAILIFGLIIKWISSPEKKDKDKKKDNKAMENFKEFLGGDGDK
ncbi:MAG: hypothetical protein ACQESC_00595 [Nanobdellota archaeon]